MRAIRLGAFGALACFAFVGGAAAQTTSSAVLSSLELQELIKRAEPADHPRLEVHFAVAAEQYAAEAKRHSAMAQAFIASPTRRTAAHSAADHCKRLEQLNLQSAATLRQLAAYAEADDHVAMAQAYRGTRITQAAVHCDRLAALSRDEAKEATEAAAMHKQRALAGVAR